MHKMGTDLTEDPKAAKGRRIANVFRHQVSTGLGCVTMAGFNLRTGGPRHRQLDQYAAVLVLGGAGRYEDASGVRRRLAQGDLILVFPKMRHTYGPLAGETWMEYYLCFQGPLFDLLVEARAFGPDRPVVRLKPVDLWRKRMEGIIQQRGPVPPELAARECLKLAELLFDAMAAPVTAHRGRGPASWLSRVCLCIESNLAAPFDGPALAKESGMSYELFRKRFRQQMGMTAGRYRALRQIDRACQLLQQGGLPFKAIAQEVGYYDEFHFSRRFRQLTGKSPRQFQVERAEA